MRTYFVTFGDSWLNHHLRRIHAQAIAMGVYDEYRIYNENNLDATFKKQFKPHLRYWTRGYGYWCWKPQIILQVLREMDEGDILNYLDVGFHLNVKGLIRMREYLEMAQTTPHGIVASSLPLDFPTRQWTKGDLLDYFDVRENHDLLNSGMCASGVFFIRKRADTVMLIQKWLDVFKEDFSFADDSPSRSPNDLHFKEHRHDQSIFDILCKLHGVSLFSHAENYPAAKDAEGYPDWCTLSSFPLLSRHDKQPTVYGRFVRRIRLRKKT